MQILRQFMLREFASRQARHGTYSLRSFARSLRMSPAATSEIMRGMRSVSPKMADRLAECLCLGPQEKASVLNDIATKVSVNNATTARRYEPIQEDSYRVISSWWHYAILSLFEDPKFDGSPAQISARLGISASEAKRALRRLERCGLLNRADDGALVWSGRNFSTSDDIASASIRKSHSETLELAGESLNRDDVSIREFSAVTMLIDMKQMPLAKKMIREFRDKLSAAIEVDERTQVYRLAIQFFPLSAPESSGVKQQE